MKLTKVTYRAGQSWNAKIFPFFTLKEIYCIECNQKQDLLFHFDNGQIIAVELKHTDLHASLKGKGHGGKLSDELVESYLPYRGKEFMEIWVVVVNDCELPFASMRQTILDYIQNRDKPKARKILSDQEIISRIDHFMDQSQVLMEFIAKQAQEVRDDEMLYSLCFQYRIPVKICESQQACLDSLWKSIQQYEKPLDLAIPQFTHADSKQLLITKMLREPFSMNQLVKLNELLIEHELTTPVNIFTAMPSLLADLANREKGIWNNVHRVYHDWWFDGLDPSENKLNGGL